jgi:hypothetical protein
LLSVEGVEAGQALDVAGRARQSDLPGRTRGRGCSQKEPQRMCLTRLVVVSGLLKVILIRECQLLAADG